MPDTPKPQRVVPPEVERELCELAVASGCQLEHVEFKGGVLRLILDRPEGGVTLADCEHVAKQASALLDVLDFGRGRYVLEVGSPGLDRPLYRPRDYRRFLGSLARITFDDPETGRKKTVVGRLKAFTPGEPGEGGGGTDAERADLAGTVTFEEEKPGMEPTLRPTWTLRLAQIQRARLEIEL
jgi:ribosome maturation factor RimP